MRTGRDAARCYLPEDEAHGVDVGAAERVEAVGVKEVAEQLGGHVPLGAHLQIHVDLHPDDKGTREL